ncbi:hypothetical protein P3S68_005611 [Capsicum galapagoense]
MVIVSCFGVSPFFSRRKSSRVFSRRKSSRVFQDKDMKETKRSPIIEKKKTPPIAVSKSFKSKGSTVRNSCRVAGNFIIMTELRNKILTMRDLLDLSPCIGSSSVNELLILTLKDLQQLYPTINPSISLSKIDEAPMHQALQFFFDTLISIGEMWTGNDEWMVKCREDSFSKLDNLEHYGVLLLDDMIKLASERMFDMMDEDEDEDDDDQIRYERPSFNSFDRVLSESYSSAKSSLSSTPVTPTSVLPEYLMSKKNIKASYSGKLNPIDVKRLSFHMFPNVAAQDSNFVVQLTSTAPDEDISSNQPSTFAPQPPPPPPPPPVLNSSGNAEGSRPAPLSAKPSGAPLPPPPPPGFAAARNLGPSKAATKLKRSSQMGSLYQLLKGKVEGSSLVGKSNGRKGKGCAAASAPAGGKQGMADVLAEMTMRSAYHQQIEEDVKVHAKTIEEMKTAITSFQTSDMSDLIKFHKTVESHLEKLTDESQVLARFEEFPTKKLEALRMAAALHNKLDSIAKTLQNWPMVPPVVPLLDKAECYFNKIKGEMDTLERTKDDKSKKFTSHKIYFDFSILVRIKELMVDVSSNCMELTLKERREATQKENEGGGPKNDSNKKGSAKLLWKAFQFAFRIYTFAGGQDDHADMLTRELAQEIETDPSPQA